MPLKLTCAASGSMLAISILCLPVLAQNQSQTEAVRRAIRDEIMQDPSPDPSPLMIDEAVAIAGNYAMGGWQQGNAGGSIIMQQRQGEWEFVCGDGGVHDPEGMVQFCGIPRQSAQALWREWIRVTEGIEHDTALVFDPPSNIRATPNGRILCAVRQPTTITVLGQQGNWYYTDYCGQRGMIHSSQLRF